jgi:hypothetical protein
MEDTRIHCEMFAKEGDHKADESLIVVTGLFLEGAAWSGKGDGKLANLPPRTYFSEFPKVVVIAHPKPAGAPAELPRPADMRRADGPYLCPVYSRVLRGKESFVMMISLKTDESPHKWILRGTCLLTSRDI